MSDTGTPENDFAFGENEQGFGGESPGAEADLDFPDDEASASPAGSGDEQQEFQPFMDEDEPEPQQGRNDGADPFSAVEAKGEEDEDEEPNALLEFNVQWRQQNEEKDEKEREEKRKRRDAAREALENFYEEKQRQLSARKQSNKSKEEEKHKEMASALEGESWQRVDSLVDIASDEKPATRMGEVLIQLKNNPLPPMNA